MPPARARPALFAGQALNFFSQNILQDRLVQTQVRDQPLEFGILLFKLLESAYLRQTHRTKLFLPAIKCLLRHTQPAADLRDRLASRFLRQGVRDLLL